MARLSNHYLVPGQRALAEEEHPYLVAKGIARITAGGAMPVMNRLAEAYIGPGAVFPNRDMPDGFVIHVEVERIYGLSPWAMR